MQALGEGGGGGCVQVSMPTVSKVCTVDVLYIGVYDKQGEARRQCCLPGVSGGSLDIANTHTADCL